MPLQRLFIVFYFHALEWNSGASSFGLSVILSVAKNTLALAIIF